MWKYSLILEQLNAIQQKQCDYQVYTYDLKKPEDGEENDADLAIAFNEIRHRENLKYYHPIKKAGQ